MIGDRCPSLSLSFFQSPPIGNCFEEWRGGVKKKKEKKKKVSALSLFDIGRGISRAVGILLRVHVRFASWLLPRIK